ncbi:hypothetical protein [Nocardioides sp. SYSU DS0663]|uniref:hypothetical protein n=1 Tax=Nocardioides sp. SYSU DS0663 TaxID=3416445 RepID=UPI003F4C91FE
MTTTAPLEVSRRRRAVRVALWVALAVAVAAVLAWYTTRPPALPTSPATPQATTPVGVPVYVGMFAARHDFARTLTVDGVKVEATANTEVDVAPLLCRGGAFTATSDPEAFCSELVDPEGQRLTPGDSLVVEVTGQLPAVVVIDRVRVGYQDGIRAGTQPAGVAHAVVRVLGR